ncbi:MAG TPA: DNA-3-methyladenine glycosylase [Thermoplasmata archaeon]|nr:DNA-3-methyladenine glycosylase [Thermoplasmata archaeon]
MRPGPAPVDGSAGVERAFDAPFGRAFYDRPTMAVARSLIGATLVRRTPDAWRAGRITETEAYVSGDPANHAALGPTLRNRAMFGPPGTLYVYRIHQVYCANVVTGYGTAVLLRSVEPLFGVEGDPRGPGRLCREFSITLAEDRTSLLDGPVRVAPGFGPAPRIARGLRVGVRPDANLPMRFATTDGRWVSSPRLRASSDGRPGRVGQRIGAQWAFAQS